jgi:hypothetical protein
LRLAHHLQVDDRAELRQLRLDPIVKFIERGVVRWALLEFASDRRSKRRSMIEVTRHLMVHATPLNAKPLASVGRRDMAALLAYVEAASGPYAH